MMTHCPKCSGVLVRSTTLIDGHTVHHCRVCRTYNVEFSPHWPTDEDREALGRQLLSFAVEVEREKTWLELVIKADSSDPRWNSYENP